MIHRTQLSVQSKLMSELGIGGDTEVWQDFNIIIPHVFSYMPRYDDDEIIKEGFTMLYMADGQFTINTPYEQFDKVMVNFWNK